MAKNERTLAPVRPNAGIEAAYRRKLDALVSQMQADIEREVIASYKRDEPETVSLAQDARPSATINKAFEKLARKWQKRFDDLAKPLATEFVETSAGRAEAALKSAARREALSIKFKATASSQDALQAVVAENVGLIRSIASEHLTDVQGLVMRSASMGRDVGWLTKELQARYGVTKRRAALIARDQSNKSTAVITKVRQQELGITEAIWMHSHGGKHPRPSHVKMDGKKYKIAEGVVLDGERVWPGTAINCRCVSRPIIPGIRES